MRLNSIILIAAAAMMTLSCSQPQTAETAEWAPAGENIMTRWAAEVSPANAHTEYPRPQMVRSDWQNLNGLWNYAITSKDVAAMPEADGQILVPFAVESALSGVGRTVTENDALWYQTTFKLPKAWKHKKVILHFGGVDWQAEPSINGNALDVHTGAYTSFEYDITPYLKKSGEQELTLKVLDATDNDFQPRGKQVKSPNGIWYTAVTGIWKSVWLEPVDESHVTDYNVVSDVDASKLTVEVEASAVKAGDIVKIELVEGGVGYSTANPGKNVLATANAKVETAGDAALKAEINVPDAFLWSPDCPYLYGLAISIERNGKQIDKVDAYTAMRKISKVRNADGKLVMALNNEPLFHYGPLDQGWWPDGLYTAPTDEAMRFDIVQTKAHGFNMIRKHIKVEPDTWFYACDQLGVLVWQDMPSFGVYRKAQPWNYAEYTTDDIDFVCSDEAKANYYKEWGEIIAQLKKFPCVVVWVPFNEHWSQFETGKAVDFTYAQDGTRLVNMASGGNWIKGVGDILDSHHYPEPLIHLWDDDMVVVLGEYGGIGLPIEGHLWQKDKNWGYVQYKDGSEVTDVYVQFTDILKDLVKKGCCAAVYTQTTDVEIEVNGFMTYDREIIKLDVDRVREANQSVIKTLE